MKLTKYADLFNEEIDESELIALVAAAQGLIQQIIREGDQNKYRLDHLQQALVKIGADDPLPPCGSGLWFA